MKNSIFPQENEFFSTYFNEAHDSVKNEGHLTYELLWNKTLPHEDTLVSKFTVKLQSIKSFPNSESK